MTLRLAERIIHQVQPTPCSCTPTCIAMALGIPVAQLGLSLDEPYGFDQFGVWLAERGIWMRRCVHNDYRGEGFQDDAVYLISVRSKNIVETDHAVLLDTRPPRKHGQVPGAADGVQYNQYSGWEFFDPVKGREGKKHYDFVWPHQALDFVELVDRYTGHTVGSPP